MTSARRMRTSDGEAAEGVVEVRDVSVVFGRKGSQDVRALKGLSFAIYEGTVFCLLGPNGSGKTTTVNLLNGLLEPTSGTVRVSGFEPARSRDEVLCRIALVPQETALYGELTAQENLMFHGDYYGVDRAELAGWVEEVLGLVELVSRQDERVATFSGGMQRRLALARALLSSPQVLLLDEPTLGVDVQSRNAIWERIRELADSGTTILLTTNYMEEAEALGDEVLIIDQGRPVVSGTPGELKARLGNRSLVLSFGSEDAVEAAIQQLQPEHDVERQDSRLSLRIGDTREATRLLQGLPATLGEAAEGIEGFELKEPNLQDVFLHFTGRALRD